MASDDSAQPQLRHTPDNERAKTRRYGDAADSSSGVRLLSVKAAAAYLGVSEWTVGQMAAGGTLPRVTLPGAARRVLIDRADLDALIARSKA